jgi:hypothetical protein
MWVGRLRKRLTSVWSAALIRRFSSVVKDPSPSSNVHILNRLTPEMRASLLWEIPSAFRWTRRLLTAIVVAWICLNKAV